MARGEYAVASSALAVAVVASLLAWDLNFFSYLGPGPGFFPRALAAILGGLSLFLLWRLYSGREATDGSDGMPAHDACLRVLSICAALLGCVALLDVLGFIPASFLFFVLVIVGVERTPLLVGVFASSISTAFFYLVFHVALQVNLPTGLISF